METCAHPISPPLAVGSQLSVVHTLPSSQVGGVPATQCPSAGLQVSRPLQNRPSSQKTVAGLQNCSWASQVSVVQRVLSFVPAAAVGRPAGVAQLQVPLVGSR